MSERRRLQSALSRPRGATPPTVSQTRHPSSIRSLRSLDELRESLTALRDVNECYTSNSFAALADDLRQL